MENKQNKKYEMISIIIPVYNVQDYIRQCIDSVINQTFTDLQIILVDDGSTDDSGAICDEYANKDNRITVIHQSNQGLGYARNSGLDIAKGKYIFFLDSDDWILQNSLKNLYEQAEENTVDLICFDCFYVENRDQKIFEQQNSKYKIIENKIQLLEMYFKSEISATAWSKLYRRELWLNIRFPNIRLHEDAWIAHLVFDKCNKVLITNQKYYAYYQRSTSLVRSPFKQLNFLCIECGKRYVEFAKENYLELINYGYLNLIVRQLYTLDKMKKDNVVKQFPIDYKRIISDLKYELPYIKHIDYKNKKDIILRANYYLHPIKSFIVKILKWCMYLPFRMVRKLIAFAKIIC